MTKHRGRQSSAGNVRLALIGLVSLLFVVIALCCGGYALVSQLVDGEDVATSVPESALVVAYSPEKAHPADADPGRRARA